jgi:hypothetical protein
MILKTTTEVKLFIGHPESFGLMRQNQDEHISPSLVDLLKHQ